MATRAERAAASSLEKQDAQNKFRKLEMAIWPRIVLCMDEGEQMLPHEYDFHMTSTQFRRAFGRPGLQLIELLFIRWMRGGVRAANGDLIKPRWKLNPIAAVEFAKWRLANEECTCKDAVKYLQSLGMEHMQTVRLFDDRGKVKDREIVSRAEKRVLLAGNKENRDKHKDRTYKRVDNEAHNAKAH